MRDPADLPSRLRRPRRVSDRGRMVLIIVAVVLVVLLLASRAIAGFYVDYLWHQSVGRTDVFWGMLGSKAFLFGLFALLFVLLSVLNLLIADRLAPSTLSTDTHPAVTRFHEVFGHRMRLVRVVACAVLGLMVAVPASGHWQEWLLFRNSVNFGKNDPQFSTDIGFYVFRLPFLVFLFDWLFIAVLLVLVITVAAHVLSGGVVITPPMPKVRRATKAHFAILLSVLALLRAGGYWLERYQLTTERRGYVQGALYAVLKAQLPAVLLLMLISLLVAALFLYSIRTGSWRVPLVACALWLVIALFGGVVYPSVIQALVVNPNEKEREAPYIARNIEATRDALGISKVTTVPITFGDLTAQKVAGDLSPVRDTRLLDPAVMLRRFTFDKGQVAGLAITDLDVDRYNLNGRVQQALVAARELDLKNVANTSWQGTHLIATHGCGLVVAPASQVQGNNRPIYSELPLDHPELYYSPSITGFAVVKTNTTEKPCQGSETAPYAGTGGIQLNSAMRRFAFALSFFDYNLWGSNSITETSRIQWVRNVRDRAEKIAPFLHFDTDPYAVALNGKALWVIDAFTTTDQYPYAQDADRSQLDSTSGLNHVFNYVRNSVKVVIDAYDGTITFYKMDTVDPILKAWSNAFPDLFVDSSKMPDGLKDHLRYPEDLFRIQTAAYARYQLAPSAFFERTGAWSVAQGPPSEPNAKAAAAATVTTDGQQSASNVSAESTTQRFIPYYTMFHTPGSSVAPTFSILRPFVPYSKDDTRTELQSFMVASSDPATYGQLTAYSLTATVDGPTVVANNAETDGTISQTITQLNQQGSTVRYGDLQLVPVDGGLLYVRPFYVVGDNLAEYRFMIVSYNARAVIDSSLTGALKKLFPGFSGEVGDRVGTTPSDTGSTVPTDTGNTTTDTPADLLNKAQKLFDEADAALAQKPADFATYQSKQAQARALIEQALKALKTSG
ncbi:MAG: hypothetical protein F2789_03615 [Actinobacteria bacterium]|nr:hypothetical protein [Actinomycetota bacterium]